MGLILMAAGNFGEYWIFSDLPHQGPNGLTRSLLWMSVLLGWLLTLGAAAVAGIQLLRARRGWWLAGIALVLPLALTFAAGALGPRWLGVPVGLLVLVASVYGVGRARPPLPAER